MPIRSAEAPEWDDGLALAPGTLGELIVRLRSTPEPLGADFPAWPPDAFAIAASALQQCGDYRHVLRLPGRNGRRTAKTWRDARAAGAQWRRNLDSRLAATAPSPFVPEIADANPIAHWWCGIVAQPDLPLEKLREHEDLLSNLICLAIAADEACVGIGLGDDSVHGMRIPGAPVEVSEFRKQAEWVLLEINRGRTLCLEISRDVVCVLPKVHTAQVGLSLRSLSHNLALCRSSDIKVQWNGPYRRGASDRERSRALKHRLPRLEAFNLLLLPWPETTDATDFEVVTHAHHDNSLSHNATYFDYSPRRLSGRAFAARLRNAIRRARAVSGHIHAILFPELALNKAQFAIAERIAWKEKLVLVAGVHDGTPKKPRNVCAIQPLGLVDTRDRKHSRVDKRELKKFGITQSKHHRWRVERKQILQYQLGGRLPASKLCWEHIEVSEREINFLCLADWLTWCVLICEDLARQDPVAEVLRAIGPNLIIALLMDGPQLTRRWSARYASVLAEDPGSSVLTLSNLGMVRRSRPSPTSPPPDPAAGHVVALWSDEIHGSIELALRGKEDACVLNLVCHSRDEYTADGHSDGGRGHFVVYAGHYPFDSQARKK